MFLHEHNLTNIPFSPSNIVMDVGLAPHPHPHSPPYHRDDASSSQPSLSSIRTEKEIEDGRRFDRAMYPVKYYLAEFGQLRFIRRRRSRRRAGEGGSGDADVINDDVGAGGLEKGSERELDRYFSGSHHRHERKEWSSNWTEGWRSCP